MILYIVEDEPRFRNYLARSIEWEELGYQVMTAENGLEALKMSARVKPDIMLMDIQMPEMDGLALAEEMYRRDPSVKIIIISGHDNFAYAQMAMKYGISKYLLKPVPDGEIIQAVHEMAEQIKQEWEKKHNHERLERQWTEHLPKLKADFYLNVMNGLYSDWEIHKRSRDLAIDLSRFRANIVAVAQMDPLSDTETRFSGKDRFLLQFSLRCIANELIGEEGGCVVLDDPDGNTILWFADEGVLEEPEFFQKVNALLAKLTSVVKEVMKLTASVGIGSCTGLESAPESYRQAKLALQERVLYGHDIVIPYTEKAGMGKTESDRNQLLKLLETALVTSDQQGAAVLVEERVHPQILQCATVEQFQELLLSINSMMIRMMQSQGWSVSEVTGDDYHYFLDLKQLKTNEQAFQWLTRVVRCITGYAGRQRNSGRDHLLQKIFAKIEQELDQDLTLNSVADSLYINPSYLSRLFKQETGKVFSGYIMEHKMEKAKELLLSGCKVHDAALATGFKEDSYFIRVFRKYWGTTPGEMRQGN
ncbi:response regulator [Paenibacillus sp. YN15]|uniref:response regulator n=1 Tax=Paenibacillus sp. YN15 TaxID=1742774 RepID=UPI000DCE2444|nr:response regulator [Paenibacillus sp. YN15]RAV01469.1 two-component system response regulator [Paenibacillus sp. YN15]